MNKSKMYMLDIETLGTYGPAVILQIAAVSFDGERETFNVKLDQFNQPKSIVTPETVEWWSKREMPSGDINLQDGINELRTYLKPAEEVWSHNFDFDILTNVCQTYGWKIPYHFKKFRDIRTLVALARLDLTKYNWNEKTHDALDDCRFQVKYCTDAIRFLTN